MWAKVFGLAAVAGAMTLVLSVPSIPIEFQPHPDAQEYAESAYRLAHGQGYTTTYPDQPNHTAGPNPSRYPPGYSVILAPATLAGEYPANLQLAAKFVALTLVLGVAWAAFQMGGGWAVGIAVTALGLSPFLFWSAQLVMSDALSAALAVSLLPLLRERQARFVYAAGFIGGYAVVVRLSAITILGALILVYSGRDRIRAAVSATAPIAGLAAYQWSAFGAPWRTGYDYWLPSLKTFSLSFVADTAGRGDGSGLFGDRLLGVVRPLVCGTCSAVGPSHTLSNVVFYALVLTGLMWVVVPPLLPVIGLARCVLRTTEVTARFVLLAVVSQVGLYLAYFYQSARFVAPSALMLLVMGASALARHGAAAPDRASES